MSYIPLNQQYEIPHKEEVGVVEGAVAGNSIVMGMIIRVTVYFVHLHEYDWMLLATQL